VNVLDLFSGIGGFSLGLERAGMRTVAFCERDEYCRAVLAKHWPDVPCFDDVRTLRGTDVGYVDVICGGFPCQDISEAGRGVGLTGERSGLWSQYRRLIEEIQPSWTIVENVSALTYRGLGEVIRQLDEIGYDAEWSSITACAVGLPHLRERLFIVAYPKGRWGQQRGRLEFKKGSDSPRHLHQRIDQPEPPRVADGVPARTHRNRALGNAVVPQIAEIIGRAILKAMP
jgi:DNA (cytosine-5)-methyltransferase 1